MKREIESAHDEEWAVGCGGCLILAFMLGLLVLGVKLLVRFWIWVWNF